MGMDVLIGQKYENGRLVNTVNAASDIALQQRFAHYAVQDEKTTFVKKEVFVTIGPSGNKAKHKIVVRHAKDQPFVFACYKDNPDWQEADDDHWFSAAKQAVEKFCATGNYTTKHDPRSEPGQRYNIFVEVDRGISA